MKDKEYYKKVMVLNCGGTIDMDEARKVEAGSVKTVLPNIQSFLNHFDIQFEYENAFEKSIDSTT